MTSESEDQDATVRRRPSQQSAEDTEATVLRPRATPREITDEEGASTAVRPRQPGGVPVEDDATVRRRVVTAGPTLASKPVSGNRPWPVPPSDRQAQIPGRSDQQRDRYEPRTALAPVATRSTAPVRGGNAGRQRDSQRPGARSRRSGGTRRLGLGWVAAGITTALVMIGALVLIVRASHVL